MQTHARDMGNSMTKCLQTIQQMHYLQIKNFAALEFLGVVTVSRTRRNIKYASMYLLRSLFVETQLWVEIAIKKLTA